jgi:clumping factor A
MSIKDAIDNGLLVVGVFTVEFDTNDDGTAYKDTGTIKSFRTLSKDSFLQTDYSVNNGDVYEKLANFDASFDENGDLVADNLYSIGSYTVSRDTNEDGSQGDIEVHFAKVKDIDVIDVEYRIVDIFESRYELNGDNFPNDDNNLDNWKEGTTEATINAPSALKTVTVMSSNNDDPKDDANRSNTVTESTPDINLNTADPLLFPETVTTPSVAQAPTLDPATIAAIAGIPADAIALLETASPGIISGPADDYSIFGSVSSIGDNDYPVDPSTEHVTPSLPDDKSSGGEIIENSSPDPSGSGGGDSGGDSGSDSGSDDDSGSDSDSDSGSDSGSDSASESSGE